MKSETLFSILKETPWWVYVIFVYILIAGIKSFHERTVSIYSLSILPFITIAWTGYKFLVNGFDIQSFLFFIGFLALGAFFGYTSLFQNPKKVDRAKKEITLAGTKSTFILLLFIFMIKYFFGFMHATNPLVIQKFAFVETALFSLISGIFMGRFMKYARMIF